MRREPRRLTVNPPMTESRRRWRSVGPAAGAVIALAVALVLQAGPAGASVAASGTTGAPPTGASGVIIPGAPGGPVVARPGLFSGTPTPATAGVAYTFAFTVNDPAHTTFATTPGALPLGITMSSAGVISGTTIAAGTYPFTVQAIDGPGMQTSNETLVVNPGPVSTLLVTANPSTLTAGGTVTLKAFGVDGFGNNVGDVTSTTTFDASTEGTCSLNLCIMTRAGADTIKATNGPATSSVGVTVSAATASKLAPAGGTPQSTVVGTKFASPLGAKVTDTYGNPIGGMTVTFGAPVAGPSATFTGGLSSASATSDSAGIAQSPALTANALAGSYTVTASLGAIAPAASASYALTNAAVANRADLVVTLSAPGQVKRHTDLTYTLTVTNDGPAAARALRAGIASLPREGFVSASPGAHRHGHLTLWRSASLAPGQSVSYQLTVRVRARWFVVGIGGAFSGTPDPNTANNIALAFTMVVR